MASITSWTRIEPRVRRSDPAIGLEARIHDPLWLLARQWQVGEFTGEDAGSPLQARARLERLPLTRYRPGALTGSGAQGARYDPHTLPLEVLVESEPARIDLRLACEGGLHFLRLLDRHNVGKYRGAFTTTFPLTEPPANVPLDRETARLVRVALGRVPDTARLAADLRAARGALPSSPPIREADRERVLAAIKAWLAWLDARLGVQPPVEASPWNPERMEYAFAVAAPASDGERVLTATEYARGDLDWHCFDQHPGATLGASADASARDVVVRTAIPGPVSYRGMPVSRWWEFEDGQVNFGAVDAEPADLLRLLLLGFALNYGNDWFLMPLALPAGAVYSVASLVVIDSFGERTLIRPYTRVQTEGSRWRMFTLSAASTGPADDDLLFLPPALPPGLRGDAIEEVLFVRDELANLAWAVERRIEEAGGRPHDRFEHYQRTRPHTPSTEPTETTGDVAYRLATAVPDYWLPLVPTRIDPGSPDIRLVRGRVLTDGSGAPSAPAALGQLLEPGRPLRLFEEEVPRSGVRVTRRYQYVRWTNGSRHLWIGRAKSVGRGEGSSGLRFDSLVARAASE
jgi:hypothetical protein